MGKLSDCNGKILFAFWTAYSVVALLAFNPERCFAMLALDVAVCFSVSDFVFIADEEVLHGGFCLDVKKVFL